MEQSLKHVYCMFIGHVISIGSRNNSKASAQYNSKASTTLHSIVIKCSMTSFLTIAVTSWCCRYASAAETSEKSDEPNPTCDGPKIPELGKAERPYIFGSACCGPILIPPERLGRSNWGRIPPSWYRITLMSHQDQQSD